MAEKMEAKGGVDHGYDSESYMKLLQDFLDLVSEKSGDILDGE